MLAPLLALVALAAAPDPNLPAQLQQLVRSGPLNFSHAGVEVISLPDGKLLFASHAHELLNPASNTKIFTSAAALSRLGPDYRWTTEVFLEAPLEKGVEHGNLTLRGKGDPALISERLWEMAAELWHQGLRQVKGDLVLDDTFFDAVTQGPGWDQEDTDRAYLAPISALASNWGSFAIYVSPGDHVGAKARVEIEPMSPYFKLDAQVTTTARGSRRVRTSGFTSRDGYHVKVSGRIPIDSPTAAFWRRVGDPTRYTGETFKQILAQRGIKVSGRVRRGSVSSSARLFYASESDSLDVILKRLNKHSSNFVAEMLVKTLGAELRGVPGSWPNGIDAIETFLADEVGIPRGSYVMRNGSGLNDVNRFSADQVVRTLAYMYAHLTLSPEYLSSLPIAGKDGTIRFRMEDTPAAGRVRAKTGTLEDVSALSGYVESLGGQRYAFSLLVNDYPSSLRQATAAEDAVAVALASAGGNGAQAPTLALADDPVSRRTRAEGYARMGHAQDPANVPQLLAALGRESDPAVKAIAAEALYRSEPDEAEAAQALVDALPATPAELSELLGLARDLGLPPPLLGSLVDLGEDGDPNGLKGLLTLAAVDAHAAGDQQAPWEQALAQGLSDVAQQAPRELLEAMASADRAQTLRDMKWLAQGLSANADAAGRFQQALSEAASTPALAPFAEVVKGALASQKPPPPETLHSLVNPAVPRKDPVDRGG
ncbi:MAG TPA: D-alanyl-D-alanine carboxypeptidase/D-alanyl-D-alanine-endopeptidase [Myxococcales bacterium]|nr:D-alanyl-D-alanine carboxypeptidase/D-alanyl-D-alanine-endopeptidase [Myxococcales bacterium]